MKENADALFFQIEIDANLTRFAHASISQFREIASAISLNGGSYLKENADALFFQIEIDANLMRFAHASISQFREIASAISLHGGKNDRSK